MADDAVSGQEHPLHGRQATNAGEAFALVLVDELARRGVRHAVVAPGSRSTPIALALLAESRTTVHVRIDERSAAYLALGIAKASGEPVAVLCTSGTATSYLHGAVMEADLARVPLLLLTADRPPELRGIGANQTVDQVDLYGRAVRWSCDAVVPDHTSSVADWRRLTARALERCRGDTVTPPGPVQLNLPLREPLIPVDDGIGFAGALDDGTDPVNAATVSEKAPPASLIDAVLSARRGVVVAGGWGGSVGTADAVRVFAERAGWPLIAEPHSNARGGSMALRATDGLLRDPDFCSANRPDLVVVVGRVGLSRALLGWLADVDHVVVAADGGPWDVTRTAREVIDCPATALARVDPVVADAAWFATWRDASERVGVAIDALIDAENALSEPRVARDVAAWLPDRAALVVASSMPIRDLDLVMRPRERLAIHANRGVSGIDGFVSTAFGVAIGRGGDEPTTALCGDLSLLHDVNGLLPGPDVRPPVTFVVINNDGGGIFSLLPQGTSVDSASFERLFGTPHGVNLERLATAYEIDYSPVSDADQLAAALAPRGGPHLVEVRTDRIANAELHARLRAVTAGSA
jgi:2-succinyl-5-enolpyruvyl-6-hydroxy-3-cyclohexene-1-carboxylate synthase